MVTAAEVNALIFGVVAERLRAMGPDEAGLFEYYTGRVTKGGGSIFSKCDPIVAEWLIANTDGPIVDVGTGIGQFAALVAGTSEREVFALEYDARRHRALDAVCGAMLQWRPETKLQPLNGAWPNIPEHLVGNAIGVFGTFTATMTDAQREACWQGLRKLRAVAVEMVVFLAEGESMNNDRSAQDQKIDRIASMGFQAPEVITTHADRRWLYFHR